MLTLQSHAIQRSAVDGTRAFNQSSDLLYKYISHAALEAYNYRLERLQVTWLCKDDIFLTKYSPQIKTYNAFKFEVGLRCRLSRLQDHLKHSIAWHLIILNRLNWLGAFEPDIFQGS